MSEKRLNSTLSDETEKQVVRPILMAEFEFDETIDRAWSGLGELVYDGKTYYGAGTLGKVSTIEETTELRATGASFQLSGIPADLVNKISSYPIQGKKALMYLGFMDANFSTLIMDPVLIFDGRMDTAEIADGGDTASITVTAESRLRDLERLRTRRYTDAEQQGRYPGDKGLEYVPSLQDKQIVWGREAADT